MDSNDKILEKAIYKVEKEIYYWQMGVQKKDKLHNFNSKLFELILKADPTNKIRLSRGFPLEVLLLNKFSNEEGYFEDLCNRMKHHAKGE